MQYLVAHHLHVACVTLSIALFILRGGLMLAGTPRLRSPVLRVLPHVVYATLLASALWLCNPAADQTGECPSKAGTEHYATTNSFFDVYLDFGGIWHLRASGADGCLLERQCQGHLPDRDRLPKKWAGRTT